MTGEFSTKRFWTGLVVILFIYSAYYLLLADNKHLFQVPRMGRHFIKMLVVFAVYFSGTFFLGKLPQKWLLQVWHLTHITLITILICFWGWHFIVKYLPANLRSLGYSIHEFLISPLLYLATGLLGKLSQIQQANNQE